MKMRGLWWWIDRWRNSTAFIDMTLEQQGAYRNLLDDAAIRGGALPNDERILAKACGDQLAWKRVRSAVMAHFELKPDGWHNDTLDSVIAESQRRSQKQQNYRNRSGNAAGNESGNAAGNKASNNPRPPITNHQSPEEDHTPKPPAAAPPDGFSTFWDVYPRKKAKADAQKAWRRLAPDSELQARIQAAVRLQAGSQAWQKDGGQFVPYPASWLRAGQWDDEPDRRPRGRIAEQDPHSGSDWFEECKQRHGGECGLDRHRHALRTAREQASSFEFGRVGVGAN